MRLLHFSDVHVGAPLRQLPPRHWLGKRGLAGLNLLLGRGRRFATAIEKLAALASFATRAEVDAVLFTGDYTALGLEQEFRQARSAIEPFLQAPAGYVNVPGNHDLYLPEVLRERRFERHFGDTLDSDLPQYRADGPWPLVRLLGERVAAVAVNSARPNPQPWRSSGKIPAAQLAALARLLADERLQDRFVFVLTHYAPRLADGRRDTPLHGLNNADEFLAVCSELKRGALLCGHAHHAYRVQVSGIAPPIFCAGSATLSGRESFWVYDLGGASPTATRGAWEGTGYRLDSDSAVALL
jgi:3',5'-cyclic AMP phosphodiesterase CpdA